MKCIFASLLTVLILASCSNGKKLQWIMSEFVKSDVAIPSSLQCIYQGDYYDWDEAMLKPVKHVVLFDSLECSACRVSNMLHLKPLFDYGYVNDFSVVVIFAPKKAEMEMTEFLLMNAELDIPVYIDKHNAMLSNNQCIPQDSRFHSFLLDANGKPRLVGNPVYVDGLWELLDEAVGVLREEGNM